MDFSASSHLTSNPMATSSSHGLELRTLTRPRALWCVWFFPRNTVNGLAHQATAPCMARNPIACLGHQSMDTAGGLAWPSGSSGFQRPLVTPVYVRREHSSCPVAPAAPSSTTSIVVLATMCSSKALIVLIPPPSTSTPRKLGQV